MAYTRVNDLMDESVFSLETLYKTKENPKAAITQSIPIVSQSNENIIDFVISEMKDTLGYEPTPTH
jgi:hypothetical protein